MKHLHTQSGIHPIRKICLLCLFSFLLFRNNVTFLGPFMFSLSWTSNWPFLNLEVKIYVRCVHMGAEMSLHSGLSGERTKNTRKACPCTHEKPQLCFCLSVCTLQSST